MTQLVCFSDMIERNGETVRQNNLAKAHAIPLGTLVEVKYDEWFGNGACFRAHGRLFVNTHDRDCDGTPLYGLGGYLAKGCFPLVTHGHGEETLTVVEVTDDVRTGEDALVWDDED